MKMTAKADSEYFQSCADKYAAYLETSLQVMTRGASLAVAAERGVRVISDYLPPQVSRYAEYERIFELERKLGSRPEFAAVARCIQIIARHSCASSSKEMGP
jgi:hypothetical protein